MKLILVYAAVLSVGVFARTTVRQQSVSGPITSLSDKDARQKASVHTAFASAGRQPGLEIWRIENFNPVAVAARDYGKFHKGDAYIVLKTTTNNRNVLSHDIHYWVGEAASQDEAGAAAILAVGLDDKFGGAAVQHRETQGNETNKFKGYFTSPIQYVDGGVASGFNHVVTNAGADKRFFQVKGKRNVRVRQVEPQVSAMNKGDVFILDVNQDILVWVGPRARNMERLKAISVANQIRDQDHNGRGRVEIIDQYSSEADVEKFFVALGSGNKNSVPEESSGGDDQTFERTEPSSATLSEVTESGGSVKVTALTRPYRQDQLRPQEAYILDTTSAMYVWIGKQASEREKSEAMAKAQQFLTSKNYPSWVRVVRVPQGTEPAIFKQYFTTWRDAGMTHTRIVRSAGSRVPASSAAQLFRLQLKVDGSIAYHQIKQYTQSDLKEDSGYQLETDSETYLWIGQQATNFYKKHLYLYYNRIRELTLKKVSLVKQYHEDEEFTQHFGEWDADFWLKQKLNDLEREEALEMNEIS